MLSFEQLEKGLRQGLRFKITNGVVGIEDLYTMNVQSLDKIAVALNREMRGSEDSFLESNKDESLKLRFEIVKHILDLKLAEAEIAKTAKADAARRQVLLAALERKQSAKIDEMSEEELKAELGL